MVCQTCCDETCEEQDRFMRKKPKTEYNLEEDDTVLEVERLLNEMNITIHQVKETRQYQSICQRLQNDEGFVSNVKRVLGEFKQLQMVIYALGSIEHFCDSQYQLAFALLLKQDFEWIGDIQVYDPLFSLIDCLVMKKLGCIIIPTNEVFRRKVEKPTLFFLPFALIDQVANLWDANWTPSQINRMVILSTCTTYFEEEELNGKDLFDLYKEALKKYATQFRIHRVSKAIFNCPHRFSWTFYKVDPNIDMETLLPGYFSKDVRMEMTKLIQNACEIRSTMGPKQFDHPIKDDDNIYYLLDWPSPSLYKEMRAPRYIRYKWQPPPFGWLKLNFSGKAQDGKRKAGYGGVIRDEYGKHLAVYCGCLGKGDSRVASLVALRKGLNYLKYIKSPKRLDVMVEGDNLNLIRWIHGRYERQDDIHEMLMKIRTKLSKCGVIYHIYPEANSLAIELAMDGASRSDSAMLCMTKSMVSQTCDETCEEQDRFMRKKPKTEYNLEEDDTVLEVERLLNEMNITIHQVKETRQYQSICQRLQNDEGFVSNVKRVLGEFKQLQMVIYALGSIEHFCDSQYQLAFALLLKQDFEWIGDIQVYDPLFSLMDCLVMKKLGCIIIPTNEVFRRKVEKPTLFFLPFALIDQVANLWDANWTPSQINRMVILSTCTTYFEEEELTRKERRRTASNLFDLYKEALKEHATQFRIHRVSKAIFDCPNKFSWTFYKVDPNIDMETLLPGYFSKDVRMEMTKLIPNGNKRMSRIGAKQFDHPIKDDDNIYYLIDWPSQFLKIRAPRYIRYKWQPPPFGWLKLNFSGKAQDGKRKAGYGGVIRDEYGKHLAVYCGCLGKGDSRVASLVALRKGLNYLKYIKSPKRLDVMVEGDHLNLIRWIHGRYERQDDIHEMLMKIRTKLSKCGVIYHIYPEANSLAIELAMDGASRSDSYFKIY